MSKGSNVSLWLATIAVALSPLGCSSTSAQSSGAPVSDGGSADAALSSCVSGDTKPCSSFTTPTGVVLPLGPEGAVMEPNVGTGFKNPVSSEDYADAGAYCQSFATIFNQSPALTRQLLNTSQNGVNLDFALYTVYRPAHWPAAPIPIITWGNGTCAQPEGYGALLRYVASYGFFIVAANSREVASGTPMLHALDFAVAANKDPSSPYYGKLDTTKIGAMGHSQGGGATVTAAKDARVKDAIIFNAADSCTKQFLAISGDMDITGFTPSSMASDVAAAPAAGAWLYFHNVPNTGNLNGHLTLMLQPDRVAAPTKDWWQMVFQSDPTATAEFTGTSCGLCNDASDHEYGEHGLP